MTCRKTCKLMQVDVTEQDAMFKLAWLSIEKNNLSLSKQDIDCCHGDSGFFNDSSNLYVHCPLNARWRKVQDLLDQTKKNSPDIQWHKQWQHQHLLASLRTLKKLKTSYEKNKSFVIETSVTSSTMMMVALEAIWLYGTDVVLVDFSHSNRVKSFYQMFDSIMQKNSNFRPAVIISRIKKLWDSQNATDFEGMLSFCYQHGFVVWVEIEVDGSSHNEVRAGAIDARRSKRLLDRVQQIRTNSFYNWLSLSCRSQLSEMTGDAKYLQFSEAQNRLAHKNNQFLKEF